VDIRAGEVVGLAGLEGSGQGVFLRVAAGLKHSITGHLDILGQNATRYRYHDALERGVTFLPADRIGEGLVRGLSVSEHFALKSRVKRFFLDLNAAEVAAREKIEQFNVKGFPDSSVDSLSGGNQQRLLLSFLPSSPRLLLLENPTRGLDMASANWVWRHLYTFSDRRTCIVFSSSEIDEIIMAADRVLVFFSGTIVLDVRTRETSLEELGSAIAGKNLNNRECRR
jgi:simple sugar transport system ATP-binding protein